MSRCSRKLRGHEWAPLEDRSANYKCGICGAYKRSSRGETYWQGPSGERERVKLNIGPKPSRWAKGEVSSTWDEQPEMRLLNDGRGCCRTHATRPGVCSLGGIGCCIDHAAIETINRHGSLP